MCAALNVLTPSLVATSTALSTSSPRKSSRHLAERTNVEGWDWAGGVASGCSASEQAGRVGSARKRLGLWLTDYGRYAGADSAHVLVGLHQLLDLRLRAPGDKSN